MGASLLVIENWPDDPAARLGGWLGDAGLALRVVRPHAGEPLPARVDEGGVLIMGGAMGANDDDDAPWLPAERALIRRLVRDEIPTLGVCLGGQLMAVATGGRVRRRADGPEIGAALVAKRMAASTDPLFAELPITPDVVQWHFDEITELPPGAIQLASSPASEHQAFRLGRLAWGVQFHIETTSEMIRDWARSDAAALTHLDLDDLVARTDAIAEDLQEAWRPFAERFAAVVCDPTGVTAPRGAPVTTSGPITDPAQIRAALAAELGAARSPLPTPEVRRGG